MVPGCKEPLGQIPSSASSPVVSWNHGISQLGRRHCWMAISIYPGSWVMCQAETSLGHTGWFYGVTQSPEKWGTELQGA